MKIVVMSDTHCWQPEDMAEIPDGDVLIHAGDATNYGSPKELFTFNAWFGVQPHPIKIFVPGNHDVIFEQNPALAKSMLNNSISLLIDQSLELENPRVRFYGSPWTRRFGRWGFMYEWDDAETVWRKIPSKVDVLITHGPPLGILDKLANDEAVGCPALRQHSLYRVEPSLHVFGHIHASHGTIQEGNTTYVNAAICDERGEPKNLCQVFEF